LRPPTTSGPGPRARRDPCLRGFAETRYRAKSWTAERRACARIEATSKGSTSRFVVTSLATGTAEHVYETCLPRAANREPDQMHQGAARLRPNELPLALGQSTISCVSILHTRRLMA